MPKVEFNIEREIGDRSSLHESNLVKKKGTSYITSGDLLLDTRTKAI